MRADVQLRRLVRINPLTPEFARATGEVTFVPLECVWPRGQADFTRRAEVESVANGYTRFRKGDVLLPKVTPTFQAGRATVATIDTPLGAASTEVHILRETARSSARYMAYLGQSRRFISEGETVVEGVGNLLRVPTDWVKAFRVPLLSRQGQEAIADFLDRETAQIDAMIEAQEVLILRISEYDSAWRAYAVLPLLGSGDRLKTAMFETEERANDAADSLPLLSVSIDWGVRRRDETSTNQAASEDLSKYKVVCKGDIVLNRMRAFQGALGHSDEDGIVSPDYAVFRAREGVNPEWLSSIMRSAPFIEEMASRIRGIGSADSGQVRTPRLNARDLLDIRLALPSQAAQEDALADWRERTGEVERVLDAASEGVRLLRERRDALITAAVTGRIDPATGTERIDPPTEKEAS